MREAMNSEYMGRFKLKGVVDVSFPLVVFFSVFFTRSLTASNPLQGELCKGKFCGEGRCQETEQFPFVECICNPGWSTFQNITSLPCVLPNCTIHSECGNAAPPPSKSSPTPPPPPFQLPNISDPCWINFCGADGSCVVTNGSDFKCQCSQGSSNLLNNPKFPCFHQCNLGEDCKGVNLGFNEAPPPFTPPHLANSVSPADGGILCGVAFCGEGKCEDAEDFPFVKCNCNDGWTNFNNDSHLPCVLPNCTVDFHCGNGSPPPPLPAPPPFQLQLPNLTDPCWINGICGPDGTCERDGSDRKCRCSDGAANLLGDPKFPCFKKCHLGADCNGFNLGFNQPPPAPPPPTNSVPPRNGYLLNGSGKLYMLVCMTVIAALVPSV